MKVALVGFGVENQAAYRFFKARGANITICDQDTSTEPPQGSQTQLGERYLDNLDRFDVVVRTVGMHPSVLLKHNPGIKAKITNAVDIFFRECKTPIIGVTGTKGKGTTSTLITKIINAGGKKAILGGNIGIPALDLLDEAKEADYVVLELSSFQLEDITASPHIGVCLMVVPEHLNWHANFDDYKRAKANMFKFQKPGDIAVFNGLNAASREIASVSPAKTKLLYAVPEPSNQSTTLDYDAHVRGNKLFFRNNLICESDEVGLIGRHNLENVCAAVAATWDIVAGDVSVINKVVTGFTGLEHRLEFVGQVSGVRYYDDSFSTTPETAIAAIKAFKEPKVVILGGSDKGIAFDKLADVVVGHSVRQVLAIGDTGPAIAKLLRDRGYEAVLEKNLDDMESIVAAAKATSKTGDIVLLSTGCASFGMFKNYKDRGEQFQAQVKALETPVRS